VFAFLEGEIREPRFEHLWVAPFNLRTRLCSAIREERERARRGEHAEILFKLNALEDEDVIDELEAAACDGVHIRGIVRGICRWTPCEDDFGGRVHLRSIVDRFLEHARAYVFGNGGDPRVFVGSADWMVRNLDRRVEVVAPIYDPECRQDVLDLLDIQFADDTKARIHVGDQTNPRAERGPVPVRAQELAYRTLSRRAP
jgi:polyphosphate kinase